MSKDKEQTLYIGQYTEFPLEDISLHAVLKPLPPIHKDDPEVLQIADSIGELGILHPLIITTKGELMDGRRRLAAAKRMQLVKVPVHVMDEAKAALLVIAALRDRAHMNKSQLAFMMVPMLLPSFQYAWKKRMANLGSKNTETAPDSFGDTSDLPKPLEEWARELKMDVGMLQKAYRVHKHFEDKTKRTLTDDYKNTEKDVTFEQFYRKRMFWEETPERKPYSLKGVLAGIGYQLDKEATEKSGNPKKNSGGRPASTEKKLKAFKETFKSLNTRTGYWDAFDEDTKEEAIAPLDKTLEKIPDDLLETMAKKFSAEVKRRKAAKEEK